MNKEDGLLLSKRIMWTTKNMLSKAIKGAYLDYYGENISDLCVKRILKYLDELLRRKSDGTR